MNESKTRSYCIRYEIRVKISHALDVRTSGPKGLEQENK
jgi:hypothetical protein